MYTYILGSSARSARALGPGGAPWALVGRALVGRALVSPPGPLWAPLGRCES